VIPPLRARVTEIAPLAERFLAAASRTLDRNDSLRLSAEALAYLERHPWPGNVRELRNVVERAAVLSSGDAIVPTDLPAHLTGVTGNSGVISSSGVTSSSGSTDSAAGSWDGSRPRPSGERERILEALEQCAGNQTRAAKQLGISLRTLVNWLAKYDIPRPRSGSNK
jgi:DNA-binding NtrC family response regulator